MCEVFQIENSASYYRYDDGGIFDLYNSVSSIWYLQSAIWYLQSSIWYLQSAHVEAASTGGGGEQGPRGQQCQGAWFYTSRAVPDFPKPAEEIEGF